MKKQRRMKKYIIGITVIIAFLIIIGEPEKFTLGNVILRFGCLFYIWLVAKANNYFYERS